eukprot:TRINITY_DN16162_c0_g3_i1.p2 TRINITY_DN16162_c0_g3~~TRINITY_DN16162_c0_g3_i1.p2  ORF type:complete len:216 (+),score=55.60 TRINITY_DN16162_c0_g3_i1:92-739(+)
MRANGPPRGPADPRAEQLARLKQELAELLQVKAEKVRREQAAVVAVALAAAEAVTHTTTSTSPAAPAPAPPPAAAAPPPAAQAQPASGAAAGTKWTVEPPAAADEAHKRVQEKAKLRQSLLFMEERNEFVDSEGQRRHTIADEQARDFGPICTRYMIFLSSVSRAAPHRAAGQGPAAQALPAQGSAVAGDDADADADADADLGCDHRGAGDGSFR